MSAIINRVDVRLTKRQVRLIWTEGNHETTVQPQRRDETQGTLDGLVKDKGRSMAGER